MPDVLCSSVRPAGVCEVGQVPPPSHRLSPSKTDHTVGFEHRRDIRVLCFKRVSPFTMLRVDWKCQGGSRNPLWNYSREGLTMAWTSMAAGKETRSSYILHVLKKKSQQNFLIDWVKRKTRIKGDFKFSALIISKEFTEGIWYQKVMWEILVKFNLKNSPDI